MAAKRPGAWPTLRTRRLLLRPFAWSDAERVRTLAGEPEVARMTARIPYPYSEAMAEEWIAQQEARLEAGELAFAIEVEGEGLIGGVGLVLEEEGRGELGYWIGRPFWGRGYATEAARALIEYGFLDLGLRRIHAHHIAENPASGRVLEKAGMKREGALRRHTLHRGEHPADVIVYGILAEEMPGRSEEGSAQPRADEGSEAALEGERTPSAARDVRVVAMGPEHWPRVREIYADGIASGHATFEREVPDWEAWDAAHHRFARLVALEGARLEGWAALAPVSRRAVYAGVAEVSLYVAADARGRGIGAGLLLRLVQESETHGIWTLQAGVFPENEASLALHRRAGFREVGRRERIGALEGRWRDVVLLERRSRRVGTGGVADDSARSALPEPGRPRDRSSTGSE